jgi:hypothetical protein
VGSTCGLGYPVGMVARRTTRRKWALTAAAIGVATVTCATACSTSASEPPAWRTAVSPTTEVSLGCPGQNSEIEQAVDPVRDYVYEEWIGCHNHIGFAASLDGGLHFGKPLILADSASSWDPSVAVAPNGTVYVAFMTATADHMFPVVEASFDHGQTFPQVTDLVPATVRNWGDRDFIAIGPTGTAYLTWDYGPSASEVKLICTKTGSCSFSAGDLNIVAQASTDGGRTWSPMVHVSPGFPASGGDAAPLLVAPDGHVYAEYQGYDITSRTKLTLAGAHSFVTSSADGGTSWTAPVRVGPAQPTMNDSEWWIDGAISADAAGNLFVTWDTQSGAADIGWLSYSTDHGQQWSRPLRVTPDTDHATHIVEVVGGQSGIAYVGWLADDTAAGYALYLRPFSIRTGWLSHRVTVSSVYGDPAIWPGDTFGLSTLPPLSTGPRAHWPRVVVSWGSAVGASLLAQDRAAVVSFRPG